MPGQPHRMGGVKGDECNCGRRASIRHCPACGSARLYAYADRIVKDETGQNVLSSGWTRCLSCSHQFQKFDPEFCDAPPFTVALARQKARAIAESKLPPNVILEAQRLAGQQPDRDVQAIADTEQEGTVDWSVTDEDVKEIIAVRDVVAKEADALQKADATGKPVEEVKKPWSHAEYTFRKEWVDRVAAGQRSVLPPVAEYVERRMKGELFDNVE